MAWASAIANEPPGHSAHFVLAKKPTLLAILPAAAMQLLCLHISIAPRSRARVAKVAWVKVFIAVDVYFSSLATATAVAAAVAAAAGGHLLAHRCVNAKID